MSKKKPPTKVSDDDAALFRKQMGDVTPLADDNRIHEETPKPKGGYRLQEDEQDTGNHSGGFIQSGYVDGVGPDESLFFTSSGLQHKVVKRLRRGELKIEDRLDLHGNTIEEAAQRLGDFLAYAQASDLRCVLVIHGRGHRSLDNKPVLKSQVNHWLRQHNAVLGFSSAKPQDGGVGAVYVLLRKAPG